VSLLQELRQAITDGELPLHLAVQATPESMEQAWASAHIDYSEGGDDSMLGLLSYTRGATLVRPALEAAFEMIDMMGELMGESSEYLTALAREGLPVALDVWNEWTSTAHHEMSYAGERNADRLRVISRRYYTERWNQKGGSAAVAIEETLDSVVAFVDHEARGGSAAMVALWRAGTTRQDLGVRIEQTIRALGPPTLEEIVGVIEEMKR
jgi:hypothetical protein